PAHKRVYTYHGPGLWWDATNQRIHIRLSHTHMDSGVGNYTGETNPNLVRISLTSETTLAATNSADRITVQRIVFQNGGLEAFESQATDVKFDHCTFRGARHVVSVGGSTNHTFDHCVFSAMLGPWVSRDDVKDQYRGPQLPQALAACASQPDGT